MKHNILHTYDAVHIQHQVKSDHGWIGIFVRMIHNKEANTDTLLTGLQLALREFDQSLLEIETISKHDHDDNDRSPTLGD